jgi:hydroxymethylbilane synthase
MTVSTAALRLGTRGSKLARWQADWTAAQLTQRGTAVEVIEITTAGDADQSQGVSAIGGVGLFTKEIQRAVLEGSIDFAVHSLKDLPTTPVPGLELAAVPTREVAHDALVSNIATSIAQLPHAARVGTSSLRRRSQLLRNRPDLEMVDIRGNVDTRLGKLDDGVYDGLVLAAAGLVRLGFGDRITQQLPLEEMLPAPGQGALGIECRGEDDRVLSALAQLNDPHTLAAVTAERAVLARVEGGCLAAIGAYGIVAEGEVHLSAVILSDDGRERLFAAGRDAVAEAESLGNRVGDDLLAQGGARLVHQRR